MDHWRNWKPLAELTAAELRVLALNYRVMAATARMVGTPEILRRLAARYEAMADGRSLRDPWEGCSGTLADNPGPVNDLGVLQTRRSGSPRAPAQAFQSPQADRTRHRLARRINPVGAAAGFRRAECHPHVWRHRVIDWRVPRPTCPAERHKTAIA